PSCSLSSATAPASPRAMGRTVRDGTLEWRIEGSLIEASSHGALGTCLNIAAKSSPASSPQAHVIATEAGRFHRAAQRPLYFALVSADHLAGSIRIPRRQSRSFP